MSEIRIRTIDGNGVYMADFGDEGPIEDVKALGQAITRGQLIGCSVGNVGGQGRSEKLVKFNPDKIVAYEVSIDE